MDRHKLTDNLLKQLHAPTKRTRIWDSELRGFYAQITTNLEVSFYFRYRFNGLARDFWIGRWGRITVFQARRLATQAAGRVAAGEDIHAEKKMLRQKQEHEKTVLLGNFIRGEHADYLLAETKRGAETLARLEHCFGHWFHLPMTEIGEWKVKRWRQDRKKLGLKNGSINRPVTALRAALNHAFRRGVIDHHPLQHLRRLREDPIGRIRFLDPDEEHQLRTALLDREERRRSERNRYNQWLTERGLPALQARPSHGYTDYFSPLVLLAMNTGLRRGELLNLRWSDYNGHAKTLTVQAQYAKSQRARHLPLSSEAVQVLEDWRRQCVGTEHIFTNPATGTCITDIKKPWARILSDAGIKDFRFHDLRHHFASKLVMRGADLNTVRALLGHSDISMTLRYAHLAPDHLARAISLLDEAQI